MVKRIALTLFLVQLACSAVSANAISDPKAVPAHAAHNADHDHHDHSKRAPLPAGSETAARCRSGAFVEAAAMLNSTVEISQALPADTPERTRSEIDVLLYTALKQAHDEVHCVLGTLTYGYDRSFAEVIYRATILSKGRAIKPEIVALGESTEQQLRAKGKPE